MTQFPLACRSSCSGPTSRRPETRILTAGPLTAELDAGNLRYISFGGREAIRAISYVVRDQYWGTFNPAIADFRRRGGRADGFKVSYRASCVGDAPRHSHYRCDHYRDTADGTPGVRGGRHA